MTSPSYLLDNRYDYDENKSIHHIDLYRLPSDCDLSILDIPAIYDSSVCLIEWPQRMASKYLPSDYIDININITPESRVVTLHTTSKRIGDKMSSFVP